MQELLVVVGSVISVFLGVIALSRYLFYTKAEINAKFSEAKAESDKRDEVIQEKINTTHIEIKAAISDIKEKLYSNQIESERLANKHNQEIYDRVNQNKQIVDDYNQSMLEVVSQLKQENKQITNDFMNIVNTIKDELKNDYINRYNELLTLINTKVNTSDFDRLENKFDKVTETITELKTIVQLQLDEHNKK